MTRNFTRPNPRTKPPANPAPPPKKERSITFSITVFETVESGEDTIDLADGEIEIMFTGKINTYLCLSEISGALRKALENKKKKLITGKLVDLTSCT